MEVYILGQVETGDFDKNKKSLIGDLWESCYKNYNGFDSLVKYAIYHDYKGQDHRDYSFSIGVESPLSQRKQKFKNHKFKTFRLDQASYDNIEGLWHEIWNRESKGELRRSYVCDFEKHELDGSITIYIGIK